jgi:steroid delta-isomerase-like uncharacterized protein
MADDIRVTMTRLYDEVVNTGNLNLIDELVDENVVEHEGFPGIPPGREGVKQFFGMMHEAFDGFRIDVEEMIVEGDKGMARGTMRGTHIGEFMGVPATEKQIEVPLVDIFRFADSKVVEHWGVTDVMAMMQQLGAIPDEAPAA